jgi:CRISPR-associated protein Csy2
MSYLLLPQLKVQAANALATPWLINATPIVAAVLFLHNLTREEHADLEFKRVAILHHDAQLLGEKDNGFYQFSPHQRRGAVFINRNDYSSKNQYALSMQPTASFHWTVSLIAEVVGEYDGSLVEQFLYRAKLAGGTIIGYQKPDYSDSLKALLEKVASGYWLAERQDLMAQHDNPVQALIDAVTSPIQVDTDKPTDATDSEQGVEVKSPAQANAWLIPAVLGYALITEPMARVGVRQLDDGSVPDHAFCEPVVGLAQYVPKQSINPPPFWHWEWPHADFFRVTTQPRA